MTPITVYAKWKFNFKILEILTPECMSSNISSAQKLIMIMGDIFNFLQIDFLDYRDNKIYLLELLS